MSIILTPAQAAALARIADDVQETLQLHQVGEDPDVLIGWSGAARPRMLLRADGAVEPIAERERRADGQARPR